VPRPRALTFGSGGGGGGPMMASRGSESDPGEGARLSSVGGWLCLALLSLWLPLGLFCSFRCSSSSWDSRGFDSLLSCDRRRRCFLSGRATCDLGRGGDLELLRQSRLPR